MRSKCNNIDKDKAIKKILSIFVLVTLIITSFVVMMPTVEAPPAYDIFVDDDADPGWYDATHVQTIQEGIDNASAGNSIYVYNGTYSGDITIDKSISLTGENGNYPIIYGSGSIGLTISADDTLIQYLQISNFSYGLVIYNTTIPLNNITSRYLTINDCSVGGIVIRETTGCNINNNTVMLNSGLGMYLLYTNNSYISYNEISDTSFWFGSLGDGIYLNMSNYNTINNNNISNNDNNAIILNASTNNTIKENDIFNNSQNGTCLEFFSENNNLFLNNLYNNSNNALDFCDGNNWDSGTYGNYWDDFDEAGEGAWDNNSDGIVDFPYNIGGGSSQDQYPLMNPWNGSGGEQGGSDITISGTVKDSQTLQPLISDTGTQIIIRAMDCEGSEGPQGWMPETDSGGHFSADVTEGGEGEYEVIVMRDGYIGYVKMDLELNEGDSINLEIYLEPKFDPENYSHIRGNVTANSEPVENAQVIFLDTNFTHMIGGEGEEPEMPQAYTDSDGYFNFNATCRSDYILIAFYQGFYAALSDSITITDENQVQWYDFSLEPAAPDTLNISIQFIDLDDAMITVNRTIVASSTILRFGLDFDPENGNNNQNVSETEVSSYLELVAEDGPSLNASSDIFGDEGGEGEGEERGGPDFLSTPVSISIDSSNFDSYIPNTFTGNLDDIVNTTISDNSTVYYNATFNISLDGSILNQTNHALDVMTYFNTVLYSNISFDFSNLYNWSSTDDDDTNGSIVTTTQTILITPGSGSQTDLAYANFTLQLNGSTVILPIVETPTWYKKDKWMFNETTQGGGEEVTYTVDGKPYGNKDIFRYTRGDLNGSYLSYDVGKENDSGFETYYVSINDIDWLVMDEEEEVAYLIDDLAFPLYNGKTWNTISWWGEPVVAFVWDINSIKTTECGIFSCIQVNYTNSTSDIVGREWYSQDAKFFVNRTQYDNDQPIIQMDLTSYSHAPFIESQTLWANDTDDNGLIDYLDVNITINGSKYYGGPTDLMIEGPLFKESSGHGPPTDIAWVWDEDNLQDFGTETRIITLKYAGSLINSSGVDGPYQGWIELREFGDWGPGDIIDYTSFTTEEYSYLQFEAPAVTITDIEVYDNDTNADGQIDYLTLNVTLDVMTTGNYKLQGGLDYVIDQGWWEEWKWITGTGTSLGTLTQGDTPIVNLDFSGSEIYEAGYDGTYKFHIEIVDEDTNTRIIENESTAGTYLHTQFTTPAVYFNKTKMQQTGLHDYINGTAYLTINALINVEAGEFNGGSGTYELCGGIHFPGIGYDWGEWITGDCNQDVILYEGENSVPLNFKIGEIQESNGSYEGNYTVNMDFREKIGDWFGPDIDHVEYTTSDYNVLSDFPDPPISLTVTHHDIIDNGNTLQVNATVTINADEYANATYELHGGVHYIETGGDDEWWYFITGTGENMDLGYGSIDVSLNFSGQAISNSGQNGPYPIWMGLETVPDHQQIASDDNYEVQANASDFATPAVQFDVENITSFINGSEYLTIELPIIVNEAESYHIHGGVNRIIRQSNWDEEYFITGTGETYYLPIGTQNLSINFEQSIIRDGLPTDYNDILRFHMGIENDTTWQEIVHLTYDTPQAYTRDSFNSSGVSILDASASIENETSNLVVNISYSATIPDIYAIFGGVNADWTWVTGTWDQYSLELGDNYVDVTFDGGEIYNSLQDGPYKIWLGIENVTTEVMLASTEFLTSDPYTYEDFSGAASGIRIDRENMSEGTADYKNSTGSDKFITINVSVSVTSEAAGNYWLDGGLHYTQGDNWHWITGNGSEISLSTGDNIVPLNFKEGDVYSSGQDGPYKIWIGIRDMTTWTDEDNYDYTTQAYSVSGMSAPDIAFESMTDGQCDYENDSGYITINATLNVSSGYGGEYELHGGIHYVDSFGGWFHITHANTWVTLSEGFNTVPLNFNIGEVQNGLPTGYGDTLQVWIGLNDVDSWDEITNTQYTTQIYYESLLPGPKIIINSVTGENLDADYLTITFNVSVNGSQYAGEYDFHGGVHYIDTSSGWEEWRFITGTGGTVTLQNGDQDIDLQFNAGDIYKKLEEYDATPDPDYNNQLTVWAGIQNITTWEHITSKDYWTASSYSMSNFSAPSLIINCVDDYRNDTGGTGKYLTVNVTINATGDSLNQAYDVFGGIHYTEGWEWRYITGAGTYIENLTENITIPFNFLGSEIRASEQNGPYEVWVGIAPAGQWQATTHDEHTTTNPYNYTDFLEPAIRIIERSIADFANDTGGDSSAEYLTINVSVNASSEAVGQTYFLEGGLHWLQDDNWMWITWAGDDIVISSDGEQIIPVNFDGKEIANAENNGWSGEQLVAWISLRNSSTWDEIDRADEYQLQNSYTASQFASIPITFNGSISDSGGSETPYTYLNVTVPIDGTSGTYTLYAAIYDATNNTMISIANSTITPSEITNGSVVVSFSGTKIYKKQYSGTFEFRAKIYDGSFLCDSMINTTNSYNYDDFEQATLEAWIVGNYSNYTNVNGDPVISVTIKVNAIDEQYELYGDLFDDTGIYFVTNAKNMSTIDSTGDYIFHLTFNNSEIQNSSISEPYTVAYLRLSIYVDGNWEEIDIAYDAYTDIVFSGGG